MNINQKLSLKNAPAIFSVSLVIAMGLFFLGLITKFRLILILSDIILFVSIVALIITAVYSLLKSNSNTK